MVSSKKYILVVNGRLKTAKIAPARYNAAANRNDQGGWMKKVSGNQIYIGRDGDNGPLMVCGAALKNLPMLCTLQEYEEMVREDERKESEAQNKALEAKIRALEAKLETKRAKIRAMKAQSPAT